MKPRSLYWLLLIALLLHAALPTRGAAALPDGPDLREGVFSVAWGNSNNGLPPQTKYFLTTADGETLALDVSEQALQAQGGAHILNKQNVTVRGTLDLAHVAEGELPLLRVSSLTASSAPGTESESSVHEMAAAIGTFPWVSIMCKFSDNPAEPKNLTYFQGMFSSAYPGLDHYWREQSYNMANVAGSTAVGWYTLPQPRSYYVYGNPVALNHSRAAADCTKVADDAGFNFSQIQGINMMFNAELDGYAWGGSLYMTLDGVAKAWRMTWEPPWGYEDITVMSHEMGHGFGLPHSSGEYGAVYDNHWDVMSDTWSDCSNSTDAIYGCLGQHTNMYHKDFLGWIGAKKFTASGGVATITLERSALPQTANYLMAQIPIGGSSTNFYVVEVRFKQGYDVKLPGNAVIIHEVVTSRNEPAHVVDTDNNGNTGDAGAMWTVGETFSDVANGISVHIDAQSGTNFVVTITTAVPPPPVGAGTYDDLNSAWAYIGTWTNTSATSAYSGAYKSTSTAGASATLYFSGVQAKLFFTKSPAMGNLEVWIDDVKVATVNQYSLSTSYQKTWLSGIYPNGVHKIEFKRSSAKVNVDALQVIPAPPPPVPVGPGTYENNNANWLFSGTWTNTSLSGASGGSVHTSSTVNNSASLLVSGASGFTLRYFTRSGFGTLGVYVDNVKVTTLNQSSGSLSIVWKTYTLALSAGTHTIKLVDASGKVNFDNIIIAP